MGSKTLAELEAELGPRGQLLPRWEKRSSLRAWLMKKKDLTYEQVSKTSISDLTAMYNKEEELNKFDGENAKHGASGLQGKGEEPATTATEVEGNKMLGLKEVLDSLGKDIAKQADGLKHEGLGDHVDAQQMADAKEKMGTPVFEGANTVARHAVQKYHNSQQQDDVIRRIAGELDAVQRLETDNEILKVLEQVDKLQKSISSAKPSSSIQTVSVVKIEHGGQQETYTDLGVQHKHFALAFKAIQARVNLALVGEPGSGKTHAPTAVAKALGLKLYSMSFCQTTTKTDLLGYRDANGHYHTTPFREAYEKGGVFIGDEFDAGNPNVGVVVNAATANDFCYFPDSAEPVKRHPDFIMVLCMNTYGTGNNRLMVGRNQLDATTLDRFATLDWNIDPALEYAIVGVKATQQVIDPAEGGVPKTINEWVEHVQAVRAACNKLEVRHVVSPRATINGAKLFKQGIGMRWVSDMLIWKGLDSEQRKRIMAEVDKSKATKKSEEIEE